MLKAFKQLNSDPVVVLKKIKDIGTTKSLEQKATETEATTSERHETMQRYTIVKKSQDSKETNCPSSLSLKINLTGETH